MARAVSANAATPGFESVEIVTLRREIESAWGAFDDIDRMSLAHRVRVVESVTGAVPDAASAAARAGFGVLALQLLTDAAAFPPPWATLCGRWEFTLAASVEAVQAVAWPDGEPWGLLPLAGSAV